MPDLAEMLGLRRRNPLADYGEGDGLETFGSDVNGLDGQLDDQMPRQMPPPLMAQRQRPRSPMGGGPPTPLPERTTPQEPMSVLPPRMEAPPQPQSALPPPIERDAPIQESQATQVDFPSRPSLPPPVGQPSPNANPVNRSVVTDLMNTPPEYQPPKPPSVKRQILGTVLGMTPARAFAPLATYGPKGLQQMQANQAWQGSLPSRVEAAKLALEEQKLNKSSQQQPHTVTTEQGIMQFNPDSQRFDIPVGPPPPKEEMMGKTVTTDQGIMMWDPKTKGYNLRVGNAPEKQAGLETHPDKDGFLYVVDKSAGLVTPVTLNGKPFQGKSPTEPASAAKNAFMQTMSKVATEGVLGPGEMGDISKLTAAIKGSKTLSSEERNTALAYLAANNTPASTQTAGVVRATILQASREYPVLNKQTKQLEMRSAAEINKNPEVYGPAGAEAAAMGKRSVFDDLHYNIDTAKKAIGNLAEVDAGTRAALAVALRDTDPKSAVSSFLTGAVGKRMNDQQREAVQSLLQLHENAMSLRSVAGMGQGSDELRKAIWATLPSAKSVDKKYMLGQLSKFEEVVKRLEAGIPGTQSTSGSGKQGDPLGIR